MPGRRTEDAIEIARNTGMDLLVAGAVKDTNYFRNEIRPKMDGSKIKYLGEVARTGETSSSYQCYFNWVITGGHPAMRGTATSDGGDRRPCRLV
jgi:hypothetical protein